MTTYIEEAVGAAAGAAGAVYLVDQTPFMLTFQSMSGGMGAGLGYVAGSYLSSRPNSQGVKSNRSATIMPLVGAAAVPILVGGAPLDTTTALLVVGAYIGGMAALRIASDM